MNSIFGIGVLEFVFILIFALIFLGPERLPKVTKEVLFFIRKLQRLSGELTRQVNEEIGDLRELDPSYHMKQLMEEEEEEEKSIGQGEDQTSTAATKQTSAPSQPAQAANAAAASSSQEVTEEKTSPQPALSDLNAAASANGRQQSGGSGDSNLKSTGTAIPSAPKAGAAKVTTKSSIGATPRRTGSTQKRGVKTLSELRKQQRAKRQSSASGSDSSYLDERNKRAQSRAENRRQAVAAQKSASEEADGLEDAAAEPADERANSEPTAIAELSSNGEGSGEGAAETDVVASENSTGSDEGAVAAVAKDAHGEGNEETQL